MKLVQIQNLEGRAGEPIVDSPNHYRVTLDASKEEALRLLGACFGVPADMRALDQAPAVGGTPKAGTETNGAATKAAPTTSPKAGTSPKKATPAAEPAPAKAEAKPEPKAPEKAAAAPAKVEPKMDLDLGDDEDEGDDDAAFSLDGELPQELVTTGRLKTIIVFLQDRGFHTDDAIIAACEKLKDRVPLLARLPSVSDRVKVALEVLHQG